MSYLAEGLVAQQPETSMPLELVRSSIVRLTIAGAVGTVDLRDRMIGVEDLTASDMPDRLPAYYLAVHQHILKHTKHPTERDVTAFLGNETSERRKLIVGHLMFHRLSGQILRPSPRYSPVPGETSRQLDEFEFIKTKIRRQVHREQAAVREWFMLPVAG